MTGPASYYVRHLSSPAYRASRARRAALIHAVCAQYLASARHVADLGAGTGLIRRELERLAGRSIVGFEIDPAFLEERDRMAIADLENLPVRGGALDFGIANHVYEHVEHLDRFFAEMARALAPAGRIYLTAGSRFALIEPHYRLPTLSWWPRPVATRLVRWSGRGEHYDDIRFTTHRRLSAAARRSGLVLEDVTDRVLTAEIARYEGAAGRLVGRAARVLPARLRRGLLRWASPQWFFFVRHAGAR
ncbi:MAG: class I SAM-dependent methyltransferase [Gemmatimonadota bacterium]